MKANELMIGDWVYSTFCDKPCKVIGIEQYESEYVNVKVTNVTGAKDIASLIPIPLTSEILEKNGFERVGTSYILKEGMFELTNPSNPDRYQDNYYVRIARQNKRIMYVHKLQHIMKEFGIEKEIEL